MLEQRKSLALVSTEAVLVEGGLGRLAPLWLLGCTAAVATGAAGLLHLLLEWHTGVTKGLLLLRERCSAGAGSCPRIRLLVSILQLPTVPLT